MALRGLPRSLLTRSGLLDGLSQDLRYAWRGLARTPAFLLISVLVIGLGVGATTTIVTVGNAVLLRTPPGVSHPEDMVTVHGRGQDGSSFHSFSYPDFLDLRNAHQAAIDLAAFSFFPASVVAGDEPRLQLGFAVTGSYFSVLGTRPTLGRLLQPGDDQGIGGPKVVVLSHQVWRDRFGGDSSLVGKAVTLNGQPFTVVGIAERGFRGHVAAFDGGLWVPLALSVSTRDATTLTQRNATWLNLVGRAPGLSPSMVEARLSPVATRLGTLRGIDWGWTVDVRRYSGVPPEVRLQAMGFIGFLLVLGVVLLLISSTNVAGVMLARALARTREIAVRLAIGASRARLVRQLLVESLLLFIAGGVVGTAIAWGSTSALSRVDLPLPIPIKLDFAMDLRVLVASLVVALATGLIFGLAPGLRATRPALSSALRDDGTVSGMGRTRLRSVLVTAQVAASAVLIVIASLFVRALGKAGAVDIGFDPERVQITSVELTVVSYDDERTRQFVDQVERGLAALPAATAVGAIDNPPLALGNQGSVVSIEGRESREGVGFFWTDFARVSPGYFSTLGIPLVRGRPFAAEDRGTAPPVVIINQQLAQRIWPGEDPIGRVLRWGEMNGGRPMTVVGVARTAKYRTLSEDPISMVYLPFAQSPDRKVSFLVKQSRPDPAVKAAVRRVIREVDPNLAVGSNSSLAELMGINLLPNRVAARVAAAFGLVGLILATVGLYGVLSYLVVRRRREIGIRLALGAPAARVRRLVLVEGLRLTLIGLAVGTALALVLSRAMKSLLFGLDSIDLVGVAGALVLMTVVAGLASDLPARRAAATEPLEVLRQD